MESEPVANNGNCGTASNEEKTPECQTPSETVVKKSKGIKKRETWAGKLDFLLSSTAYAVGLSNLWRFPYLCYKYGGGSYLLAYTIMLIFVGFPLYFLELALGQYSSIGSAVLFRRLCPIFSGVGNALWISSILGNVAYSVVISWTLFYLGSSFTNKLKWSTCNHDFNTENCVEEQTFRDCKAQNGSVYANHQCYNNATTINELNLTDTPENLRISPEEEYLNIFVLNKSSTLDQVGSVQWRLIICVGMTWLIVLLCCIRGIKSSGKVVYVTAAFGYTMLIVLLVRGLTLDGAVEGIKYFVVPHWEELGNAGIWQEAAVQVFYSISIASGGLMTMASYNKFDHNIIRDAIIVPVVDFIVNIIAGLSVFSVLGFMAKQLGKTIDDVANKGSGLAFVTYAQAISRMPVSPLWAILFFLMLCSFGLDSIFGGVTNVVTGITDNFPVLRRKRALLTVIVCVGSFLLTIPLVTGIGVYLVELIFSFLGWPKLVIALIECFVVCCVYGIDNFMEDLKQMLNWTPNPWIKTHFQFVLMTVTPGLLIMILVIQFYDYEPYRSGDYYYPTWGQAIGWTIGVLPFLLILIPMFKKLFIDNRSLNFSERWERVTSTKTKWRTAAAEHRSMTEATRDTTESDNYHQPAGKSMSFVVNGMPSETLSNNSHKRLSLNKARSKASHLSHFCAEKLKEFARRYSDAHSGDDKHENTKETNQ
ncbi:Uncharacterised protein g7283 [Pycnogonum litorale]